MEKLNKPKNESFRIRGLGNNRFLLKEIEKDSQGKPNSILNPNTPVGKLKKEFPLVNLFQLKAANQVSRVDSDNDIDESFVNHIKKPYNKLSLKRHFVRKLLSLPERSEIFVKVKGKIYKIGDIPKQHSNLVEHSYCKTNKTASKNKEKVPKSTSLNSQSGNTPPFGNRSLFNQNRMEQPTVVVKKSTTNHVDSDSGLRKICQIKDQQKKKYVSTNNSNLDRTADVTDARENNNPGKFLTPKIRIRRSSKGSGDYYDIVVDDKTSMPPPLSHSISNSIEIKKITKKVQGQNLETKEKQKVEARQFTYEGVTYKIAKMDPRLQSTGETLIRIGQKNTGNVSAKNNEVAPLIIKKITSQNAPESQKGGGYTLAKPNATKTVPQDKNWNMEYTEDDVRNLGLDDLLLRASELNAENFTKALGQNSGGRTGNKGDSSDIVLSFPPSKRESDEPLAIDDLNEGGMKRSKLETQNKGVSDDNAVKPVEEELKKAPEVTRRPALKVKTVENINEEFRDSLGAKMKKFEGRDIVSGTSLPLYTVNDDLPTSAKSVEITISDGKEKVTEEQSNFLTCKLVKKLQEPSKTMDKMPEDTRPVVMKIIQNKNIPAKDLTSTGLAGNVFAKPKLKPILKRPTGITITKLPEGTTSYLRPKENVTLVVPKPKPIEVIDLDDCTEPAPKKVGINSHFVLNRATLAKKDSNGKNVINVSATNISKNKNIPVVLNNKKKYLQMQLKNNQKLLISPAENSNIGIKSSPRTQINAVNPSIRVAANVGGGNNLKEKPGCSINSIEEKGKPKDAMSKKTVKKYVRVIPSVSGSNNAQATQGGSKDPRENKPMRINETAPREKEPVISLLAFANILRDVLPERWILSMDKKFGLQIIKTHLDEYLNPTIMISVVVSKSGKVTVNVRGRQLENSHDLFNNLCDVANSKNKISINYILAIINKLRFFNVCFGCDDLTLKKYWCEDGFIEYFTEFQQTYRSHICESLVRLGRKRCHPCYRMHESLKKRRRREQLSNDGQQKRTLKPDDNVGYETYSVSCNYRGKDDKRNLEDYIEEAFVNMKQKISNELERLRNEEENNERVPRTQEEVLGSMGLARRDSLDVNVRKSKREKKGTKQSESLDANPLTTDELYFLDSHWQEINVLFSTNLLVGAYSRTSIAKLKEKCETFYSLLATWRDIVRDNAEWVGGYFNLAEDLVNDDERPDSESVRNKFDSMDAPALRAYIINCVKEVNRMKNRFRSKNRYFRALYNSFLKPNMKRGKQTPESICLSDRSADFSGGEHLAKKSGPEKKRKRVTFSDVVQERCIDYDYLDAPPIAPEGN